MKPAIPDGLMEISADITELEEQIILDNSHKFATNYEIFKQRRRDGRLGKTAKYWIIYLDMMKYQHMAHTAVQENDFEMRIYAWEKMLSFYFDFNKTNYARYGMCYVQQLHHFETLYPGLKSLLKAKWISVQAQSSHHVRTSIDQLGEQTINRDAKTAG